MVEMLAVFEPENILQCATMEVRAGGADTRRDAIYLAKQSMTYCDECAILAQKKQN